MSEKPQGLLFDSPCTLQRTKNGNICVLTDVYGALTTKPQNALVLRGQDAFLNCSSPMGLQWDHDLGLIFTSPCKPTHSKLFVATASDSSTCNIRAVGSNENGISGEYRCSDTTEKAVAIVIVLGEWHNLVYIYFKFTHNGVAMKDRWTDKYTD